jgi:hypothetical protein
MLHGVWGTVAVFWSIIKPKATALNQPPNGLSPLKAFDYRGAAEQ